MLHVGILSPYNFLGSQMTVGSNMHHLLPWLPCSTPLPSAYIICCWVLFTAEHDATLKHCIQKQLYIK